MLPSAATKIYDQCRNTATYNYILRIFFDDPSSSFEESSFTFFGDDLSSTFLGLEDSSLFDDESLLGGCSNNDVAIVVAFFTSFCSKSSSTWIILLGMVVAKGISFSFDFNSPTDFDEEVNSSLAMLSGTLSIFLGVTSDSLAENILHSGNYQQSSTINRTPLKFWEIRDHRPQTKLPGPPSRRRSPVKFTEG
uniref:Uncharacterized protein n=1 Tax=Romanomermis culicivorax TaxID=13658 RepID=A0A915L582_ROMCU